MTRRALLPALLAAALALSLAACGKKGEPEPPPDKPDILKRKYPTE
jgi:predicted small lipoprotein YifL